MHSWRLLITPPWDGYLNMAVDEFLFDEAREGRRPPTLRFYQWEGDWVSYGYFQTPEKAMNLGEAVKLGFRSVRRPTGGRGVVHSKDLTYALAAGDAQREGLGSSLKETYRQIARALSFGLLRLGLPVAFSFKDSRPNRTPGELGGGACFLTLSDYEISIAGKKLAGSAQRREGSAFLQHGSIPLSPRNRELALRVLVRPGRGREEEISGLRSRYATVEEAAGRRMPVEELAAALKEGFSETFGVRFEEEKLLSGQMASVQKRAEKYASREWNERKAAVREEKRPLDVLA